MRVLVYCTTDCTEVEPDRHETSIRCAVVKVHQESFERLWWRVRCHKSFALGRGALQVATTSPVESAAPVN